MKGQLSRRIFSNLAWRSQQPRIETGPHLSHNSSFSFINSHQKRAKILARSAWRRVAPDDELLLTLKLQLYPGAAASAWFINRVLALADKSFQPDPSPLVNQFLGVFAQGRRKPDNSRRRLQQFLQQPLTFNHRTPEEILSVEAHEIERIKEDRRSFLSKFEGLQQLK